MKGGYIDVGIGQDVTFHILGNPLTLEFLFTRYTYAKAGMIGEMCKVLLAMDLILMIAVVRQNGQVVTSVELRTVKWVQVIYERRARECVGHRQL